MGQIKKRLGKIASAKAMGETQMKTADRLLSSFEHAMDAVSTEEDLTLRARTTLSFSPIQPHNPECVRRPAYVPEAGGLHAGEHLLG